MDDQEILYKISKYCAENMLSSLEESVPTNCVYTSDPSDIAEKVAYNNGKIAAYIEVLKILSMDE